ncbi:Solute carrier family 33 member 1 [Balamuthia mandrillaris]
MLVGETQEDTTAEEEKQEAMVEGSGKAGLMLAKEKERRDRWSMVILIILYMIQGVPLGLTLGSLPFLIQNKSSYTQIGVFSLASYPYSLKLLWSPLVDGVFSDRIGRRKSWIVPIQFLSGLLLYNISLWIEDALSSTHVPVTQLTITFFVLVVMVATQDIAVDGWALTMLSRAKRGYASTCQTIGLNCGYFLSFTIFLALNSAEFSNAYLRSTDHQQPTGVLSVSMYIRFWAIIYLLVTFYLAFFQAEKKVKKRTTITRPHQRNNNSALSLQPEEKIEFTSSYRRSHEDFDENEEARGKAEARLLDVHESEHEHEEDYVEDGLTVTAIYTKIWQIVNLQHMRKLLLVLVLYKIGFMAADSVGALKLIEKGFKKEDLALFVLIEFPFQICSAVLAGRWSSGDQPLKVWLTSYKMRLAISSLSVLVIYFFPASGHISYGYYFLILGVTLATSFAGTVQFVSQGAFFARISDSSIGGTYLTLLNTFSNFGGTWPKFFVLYFVDFFTTKHCILNNNDNDDAAGASASLSNNNFCASEEEQESCVALGGTCTIVSDGYYLVAMACSVIGLITFLFLQRYFLPLQHLKKSAWMLPRSSASSFSSSSEHVIERGGGDGSSSTVAHRKSNN